MTASFLFFIFLILQLLQGSITFVHLKYYTYWIPIHELG